MMVPFSIKVDVEPKIWDISYMIICTDDSSPCAFRMLGYLDNVSIRDQTNARRDLDLKVSDLPPTSTSVKVIYVERLFM